MTVLFIFLIGFALFVALEEIVYAIQSAHIRKTKVTVRQLSFYTKRGS